MDELLYSVRELFAEYLDKNECQFFNIPEYQRGYKWTAENVIQLLDDLSHFKKSSADDFYCLQNITITKGCLDEKRCLNVIDGQQRLTTLFIILSYLQKDQAEKYVQPDMMKYSIRVSTHDFLCRDVQSGKIWNQDIVPESMKSKDQYYIALVCKAIKDWFANKNLTTNTFLDDLKLIVNLVDNNEEETVFASLNGGKVDLDGADLVRAILITRAAKQKYGKETSTEKVNSFRVRIGMELDDINSWWAQKNVTAFFEQLLPNRINQNKNFRYSNYPIDLLYFAYFEAYKSYFPQQSTELNVRHFENGIDLNGNPEDDHLEFYNSITEFHKIMVDWYEDDETFNLLGYLMSNFKKTMNFSRLWEWWNAPECEKKSDFRNKLKKEIRALLAHAFVGDAFVNDDIMLDEKFTRLLNAINDFNQTNWYEHNLTKVILPLADILPIEIRKNGKVEKVVKRVNMEDFKASTQEDKEHVRSQTRKLDKENLTEEQKQLLMKENKEGLNSIGNIVLLHQTVNRSYGNAKHCLKMDRIINEYAIENIHIRPHTFNVFRSKLSNMEINDEITNEIFWSEDDIRKAAKALSENMDSYLFVK